MAADLNAEQIQQNYIAAMGPELGAIFYRLWNECAWLHVKWSAYETLFGTKIERILLLNRAAPMCIRIIQDSLWDDVLLHLCRLTDPSESFGKANLTVQQLPGAIDSSIRPAVEDLIEPLLNAVKPLKDLRNRRIAHKDLLVALNRSPSPLLESSRRDIKAAMVALVAVMNAVESHYQQSEVAYDIVSHMDDAEQLLYLVRDGLDARAELQRKLEAGDVNDFKGPRPI